MFTRKRMVGAALGCVLLQVVWAGGGVPATEPGDTRVLSATVTEVEGLVEVRDDEEQPWQDAKLGMVLKTKAECRTGPKSSIKLTLGPGHEVVLDRLGTVKILEAVQQGNKVKADLGMKYGKIRYHIEGAGLEHDSVIRSPSSALGVRGSDVEKIDYALMSQVIVYKGLADRQSPSGGRIRMGTGPEGSYVERPVVVDESDNSAADHAEKGAATPYSKSNSLVREEQLFLVHNNNVGGMGAGVAPFKSVQPPPSPVYRPLTAKGRLLFDLHWTGDGTMGLAPDLDLFVVSPLNERLSQDGSHSVPSGGILGQNDKPGLVERPDGYEFAVWDKAYPLGRHMYGVRYVGTGEPGTFSVVVKRDGKQINANFIDIVHEADPQVTFSIEVLGKSSGSGTAATGKVKRAAGSLAEVQRIAPMRQPRR